MIRVFVRVEADLPGDQQGCLVLLQLFRELLEAHRRRGIAEVHGKLVELGAQLGLSRFELCDGWIRLGTKHRGEMSLDLGNIGVGDECRDSNTLRICVRIESVDDEPVEHQ